MPHNRRPSQRAKPAYAAVASVFSQRCTMCHSGSQPALDLSLGSYAQLTAGSQNGPVVIPGNPEGSELVRRIRGQSLPRMPFDGPPYLDAAEIALITEWIKRGAPDAIGIQAAVPAGAKLRLGGRLSGKWALDGLPLVLDGAKRSKKAAAVGAYVEVRGVVPSDGGIRATRIRPR
ncbi:MAG: hypothetical protein JSW39_04465 [Desulfobacterales bacterium]|nr:MAG: hypothetical protein JSW39_04465 [Desulfobacterales bacterium]